MARSCARSRACDLCRSRKKKCDEQVPTCSQCKKAGMKCSGPVAGALIVAFKPQNNYRDVTQQGRTHRDATPDQHSLEPDHEDRKLLRFRQLRATCPIESYDTQGPLQSLVDISSLTMRLSEFFLVPSARQASLVASLPALVASNSLPYLRLSILASAMMLGGVLTKDKARCLQADQKYGLVLNGLRTHLLDVKRTQSAVSVEMICVSAVLVYYAGVRNWETAVACQHVLGAARMMCTRNPTDFKSGLPHEVFRVTRSMVFSSQIFLPRPVPFATDDWLTVPFSSTIKSSFDKLLDLMLAIPSLMSRVGDFFSVDLRQPSRPDVDHFTEHLDSMDSKIRAWWPSYEREMMGPDGQGWVFYDVADDWVDSCGKYHPKERYFRHDGSAECVFYYELSQYLITIMRALFCDKIEYLAYRRQAMELSSSMFAATLFPGARVWEGYPYQSLSYLSLLQVVSLASPDQTLREFATKACDMFADPTPLSSIISPAPFPPFWEQLRGIWDAETERPIIRSR